MVRDTVRVPARRGPPGLPRRRALLRRLPRRPGLRARGGADRASRPAPRSWRCATPTAGCCRPRSPTSSHAVREATGGGARHPLPQRHRLRGRELARRRRRGRHARAGHPQRLRRADRQRRPAHRRRRTSSSSSGRQVLPAGPARRGDPDRPRGQRDHERPAVLPAAVRRRQRLRPQGRPARQRDQGRPRPLPAHRPHDGRQRHADAGLRHGRPRLASSSRARELGLRPGRRPRAASPGSPTGSRRLEAAGYTFEAADASFELLLREEVGRRAAGVLRGRVVAGHHRVPAGGRRGGLRGDGQAARRRRAAGRAPARATARSTPSTTRCARRCCRSTPSSPSSSSSTSRCASSTPRHGTDAVTRVLIETTDGDDLVDDRRRRREHRRGVVGGARATGSSTACCRRASRAADARGRALPTPRRPPAPLRCQPLRGRSPSICTVIYL